MLRPILKNKIDVTAAGENVYSVSRLNQEIRVILEGRFPSLWVEGEISNFKHHTSGHMYLTLKDDKSQIGAVFFARQNQNLRFDVKDGLKVLACGRISLYEPRGQYQLYIERLEPKGIGSLQLAFQQLKEKLEKQGLFDPAHKKAVPKFPRVVGVITSPTGAAIRDILNVIGRRFRGTQLLIYPVRVQGEGAAQEIARAVREMNEYGKDLDVLIVGRGGGSLEDLWAFNEEIVARAIYDSRIPVISAVGHEIDWTICDLVADLRAPTPSAAAELVVQNREELENRLEHLRARLRAGALSLLAEKRSELEVVGSSYAFRQPAALIQQFSQRLDDLTRQMTNYLKAVMAEKSQLLQNAAGKLNALSPLAILERGYSLTFTASGNLLRDTAGIKAGDVIRTRFWRGTVDSKIIKIESQEDRHHE